MNSQADALTYPAGTQHVLQLWAFHQERTVNIRPSDTKGEGGVNLEQEWAWVRTEEAIVKTARLASAWNMQPQSLIEKLLTRSLLEMHRDGASLSKAANWPMAAVIIRSLPAILDEICKERPFLVGQD